MPRILVLCLLALTALPALARPVPYPAAPPGDHVDVRHGERVPDPYRWLEDLDGPATRRWITEENDLTEDWLARVPARDALRKRLDELQDYERYSTPWHEGKRWFWYHNSGLQNQSVLYFADGLEGTPRVAVDPNGFSPDGTVALAGAAPSRDGRYLAYGVSDAGSDWSVWKVRDLDSGRDLPDTLRWVKFSGASWTLDGRGFYYCRFPEPGKGQDLEQVNHFHSVWFHRLGTPQEQDVLVYRREDQPEWTFDASVTEDGDFLVLQAYQGKTINTALLYQDLRRPGSPVVELLGKWDAVYAFVDNEGERFLVKTDRGAPRYRLLSVGLDGGERELVPQSASTLEWVSRVGDRLIAEYLVDARSQVKVFDLAGRDLGEIALPGVGSAGGFGGKREDRETFYSFTGYTTPGIIYRYDLATGRSTVWKQPRLAFDPAKYETRQVFVTGKDGTRVPMFLSGRKGLEPDGNLPVLLYGYGGFGISMSPYFSTSAMAWMERGGVYAVANLRGGGEYGEEWHLAGTRTKKQNVFDDFIACAEWLVAQRYTNPRRLAIQGGSNGGLLVGACLTQRPDLFGACVAQVGVLDMLRFPDFTIGYHWVSDYGSPEVPEEYRALRAYSPYHNLKPGTDYPATLITTGDHDDRVFPGHSFKFAAALQAAQGGKEPVLIRIETRAGHGAGKPTAMRLDENADVLAFLVKTLGMEE